MSDLAQLIELWRERFPERARGGEAAILGFRFQFIVALRDAVRAFRDGQVTDSSVFIDRVSDVCQRTPDGEIVFTQVKRTGRTVAGALEELWCIHALASQELPLLVPKLRYRVLCSRWMLRDVCAAIDRWQPVGGSDLRRVESFKTQVTWAADPNPFDELLAMVANGLDADEPLPTVLSWIGRLTEPESGSREIWWELQGLRKKQQRTARSRLYLWSSEDRPPSTVDQGDVLIGEQPKVIHLRRGYFVDRPLYRALAEEAIEWISSGPRERDPALRTPILWIGGRSGCGKSVALLYLVSQLHQEGLGPVLWLGSGVNLLPEAVRRAPGIAGPSDQVIIALDDPYSPRTQGDAEPWRAALAELEQLQNQTMLRPPILLCCGPTGQARQLQEDFSDDVRIHALTVPHTLEDRKALERWFEHRTGSPPPDVGSGDVLLAQLFFEWRTGEALSSFALRFRERLREEDPTGSMRGVVYRIVAVNRLYAGYPSAALNSQLSPEQRDAFEQLLMQHHFAIDEDPGQPGTWLTHPHLADTLFEAWCPTATARHERQAVIKNAVLDGLRYGDTPRDQTATLWALARLTRADEPLRRRLEADRPEDFLPDVYAAWRRDSGGSLSFSHLPAWITLRFALPNLRLDPDPVGEAFAPLLSENRDDTGFRLTCHKLLEHWHRLTDVRQREATRLLVRVLAQTQEWRDWPFIAVDAVWRIDDDELRRLVEDWLLSDDQGSSFAFSWLLLRSDLGPNREWLFSTAIRWIQRHRSNPDAGPVLSGLLKRRDLGLSKGSVVTLALDWVQECLSHPQVERVLRRLLGVPMSPVVTAQASRLALDYMEQRGLQESSSFLIPATLRARVIDKAGGSRVGMEALADRMIRLGSTWLGLYADRAGAPYVADRLLRLPWVSDAEWLKVASWSVARLHNEPWHRDADYTLVSVARRQHLLSEPEKDLFSALLRSWLDRARKTITELLSRRSFFKAAKLLAPTLPLVAHLGDTALQEEFEAKVRDLRKDADKDSRTEFDGSIWSLFKVHAWPTQSAGGNSLRRIGLIHEQSRLIGKLKTLAATKADESNPSLRETLDAALEATETALESDNFKLAGYLLAKMLPLAARIPGSYLTDVEELTRRLTSSPLPIAVLCGFIRECDEWIEQNVWPSPDQASQSLARIGLDTPRTLERLARADDPPRRENVLRILEFVEELFVSTPLRAGLFLAPLLVLAAKVNDAALDERCKRVVRNFLVSAQVSESVKAGFADRVKLLTGAAIQHAVRTIVESLGLQAPWLVEEAHAAATVSPEELRRHLRQAEQLVEAGSPGRAGTLLAPVLALAAGSDEAGLLEEACEAAVRMLEHPRLTHEHRDGFASACGSLPWPNLDVQDQVFQVLGIGAPRLERLLLEVTPVVSADLLRRSLDYAEGHLQANRPGSAHHILQSALPLASWTGDENTLENALDLARCFLVHPRTSQRLRDHFLTKCVRLYQEGRWHSSDVGRSYLRKIGLKALEGTVSSDQHPGTARTGERQETPG